MWRNCLRATDPIATSAHGTKIEAQNHSVPISHIAPFSECSVTRDSTAHGVAENNSDQTYFVFREFS
jgi:hypothetical protein